MYDPFLPDHCIVDRYPIVDVSIPTEEYMVTILDAIDKYLSESKVPYIHCWGGIAEPELLSVAGSYVTAMQHQTLWAI